MTDNDFADFKLGWTHGAFGGILIGVGATAYDQAAPALGAALLLWAYTVYWRWANW